MDYDELEEQLEKFVEDNLKTSEDLGIIVADCVKDNNTATDAFKILYERLMTLEKLYTQ